MKTFYCVCGNRVFFENTHCNACGRRLGYDPNTRLMLPLEQQQAGVLRVVGSGDAFRPCRNTEYQACNWLTSVGADHDLCLACRLNRTIPNLEAAANLRRWQALEAAKRRLVYSLLELDLPIVSKSEDVERGLAFDFLEDRTTNPRVVDSYVATGHARGLITINVVEADDATRERTRNRMNEPYRTLLGHFRHESGHYYWDRLIKNSDWLSAFRQRFGDERADYSQAMQDHYQRGAREDWREAYISAYACAHPWEDWAETWAHYLHMADTLETALSFGVVAGDRQAAEFEQWLAEWMRLTVIMNELNRSMGAPDAYPFVLSPTAIDKLRFVHRVINARRSASPASVVEQRPA